jgi:tRNA G18 (ribose-2'-O)-methylase SpoU
MANADNMGGLFRNAAAFGATAVVVSPGCCDPFYRKAIRVSMGAVFRVPSLSADRWPSSLDVMRESGFVIAALTTAGAVTLEAFLRQPERPRRLVLLVGNEGAGLSEQAVAAADVALRIPMVPGFDSLNVATVTGIALYRWRETGESGAEA